MQDEEIHSEIERENTEARNKSQKSSNEGYIEIDRIENAGIDTKNPEEDKVKTSVKRSKEMTQNPYDTGLEKITDWDRM